MNQRAESGVVFSQKSHAEAVEGAGGAEVNEASPVKSHWWHFKMMQGVNAVRAGCFILEHIYIYTPNEERFP